MNIALREHEKAIQIVAKELEDNGYTVVFEPSKDQIPFSLGNYIPDLVATKNDDNLIIEIKNRATPAIVDRYRKIADIVKKHPNWKFLIKTFSEISEEDKLSFTQATGIKDIQQYLDKVLKILSISPDLAIPYFWNIIIVLLRNKATNLQIKYFELTDRSLINQLYTLGELSAEEHETLIKWNMLRNNVVHGVNVSITQAYVIEMLEFIKKLSLEEVTTIDLDHT